MPNRMINPMDSAAIRAAQRSVTSASDALQLLATNSEQQTPSLARTIDGLKHRRLDGYEREALEQHARDQNIAFDHQRPEVPWGWLATRTPLEAMGGSANGGFLVGTTVEQTVLDILRPWSVMLRSGVRMRTGLQENNVVPKADSDVAAYWLNVETNNITESEPLIGAIAIEPKDAGILVRWSLQLAKQAPDLETFLRNLCAQQIIQLLDTAAINGTGAGQPFGILQTPGVGAQSGAAFTWATAWAIRTALAVANTNDSAVAWLATPAVRGILAARENAAGDSYIWDLGDTLAGRRANVSTIMPSATMIAGDFSQLVYALFGSGFLIDTTAYNSSSDFQSGIMAMRLLVACDIYLEHPASFVVVSNVT
jgi:HK97 family phage major capsid protein